VFRELFKCGVWRFHMGEKGRKEISKIKRGSPNLSTLSAPL